MLSIDDLVDRANRGEQAALESITGLAFEPSNRAALFHHPLFFASTLQRAALGCSFSRTTVQLMSVEPSTHRQCYLHPGVVGSLVQNLYWGSIVLCNLLRNGQNRMDFVRSGNADLVARIADSAQTDSTLRVGACKVLCVAYDWEDDRNTAGSEEGEELSLDTMRQTFMRAPGRMDLVLQFKDTRDKLHIFTALAKNQRLVKELLAHPGVVQLVADEVGGFAFRLEVEECLLRVLGNDPPVRSDMARSFWRSSTKLQAKDLFHESSAT